VDELGEWIATSQIAGLRAPPLLEYNFSVADWTFANRTNAVYSNDRLHAAVAVVVDSGTRIMIGTKNWGRAGISGLVTSVAVHWLLPNSFGGCFPSLRWRLFFRLCPVKPLGLQDINT
jgi:hypothetical protein